MRDWRKREPIVIVSGAAPFCATRAGREYLDANSSIWTNLHGHRHPAINAAITRQLGKSRIPPRWAWPMSRPRCWPPNWPPGRLRQNAKAPMGLLFRRRLDGDGGGAENGLAIHGSHRTQPKAEIPVPAAPPITATPSGR
jgi:hypothetical protein